MPSPIHKIGPPSGRASGSAITSADRADAREGKATTSFIQRHLNIGHNRATKLIEQMEKEGIVGAANHVGKRKGADQADGA
jgi:DNA segregation ATPase FtsK/SpoIIIE, S-DNA-T family